MRGLIDTTIGLILLVIGLLVFMVSIPPAHASNRGSFNVTVTVLPYRCEVGGETLYLNGGKKECDKAQANQDKSGSLCPETVKENGEHVYECH